MKHLLLFTVIFLQLQLLAQNFTITEQHHWGTTDAEYVKDVEKTSDGGYLYVCESFSYVNNNTLTDTLYGAVDVWLVRLDANKNVLWNKTFGGYNPDVPKDIIKLSNGNYLILCSSSTPVSGNKTTPNFGNYDVWVICINENGDVLWQQTYGTDMSDGSGYAYELTPNKITFFVGTNGGVSGNKSLPSKGGYDGWLVTIDTLGTILNEKVFGGSENDAFGKIEKLDNGHYLLHSSSESGISGDKNSNSFGGFDAWLLEVDTTFGIVNQFAFGGTGGDNLIQVIESSNNYLFFGGSDSPVSGNKTSPKRCMSSDAILLQTDKNFTILNEKSFGDISASLYRIDQQIELPNNKIIFTGMVSGSASPYNSRISNGRDIWLMQVDDSLNQTWNYSFGSVSNDLFVKGFVNSNYELELFGNFDSPASYDISVSTFGGKDVLYVKLSSDLSILESQLAVGVYPNPSRGVFQVTSATPISAYSVFSVVGRLQANGTTLTGSLDLQHLPAGTYIANFVSGKTSSSLKLVIE
jgi:hypothetical protein